MCDVTLTRQRLVGSSDIRRSRLRSKMRRDKEVVEGVKDRVSSSCDGSETDVECPSEGQVASRESSPRLVGV